MEKLVQKLLASCYPMMQKSGPVQQIQVAILVAQVVVQVVQEVAAQEVALQEVPLVALLRVLVVVRMSPQVLVLRTL